MAKYGFGQISIPYGYYDEDKTQPIYVATKELIDLGTPENKPQPFSFANNDYVNMNFFNLCYKFPKLLSNEDVYHLTFKIRRFWNPEWNNDIVNNVKHNQNWNFNLYLGNEDFTGKVLANAVYQKLTVSETIFGVDLEGKGYQDNTYSYLFTPNRADKFEYLIFKLDRDVEDFVYSNEDGGNGRCLQPNETLTPSIMNSYVFDIKLETLTNLFDKITNDGTVIRVGIQAPTGTLFSLGGEQMKIGRRGIYENTEDINLTTLSIVPPTIPNGYLGNTILIDYKITDTPLDWTDDISV